MYRLKSNEEFLEEVCHRHFKQIYSYCRRLLKGQPSDLAEECTQMTFFHVYVQVSKLKTHPNIQGWLFATSRNQVNATYRRLYRKRKYEVVLNDKLSEKLVAERCVLDEILNSIINIDSLVEVVLDQLSRKETELYMDYYKKHLTVAELARKHHISHTALTTRIYRLKQKIKAFAHLIVADYN